MEEKKVFDYTKAQWMTLIVCYCIYFVFGGIESSQGVYYSVMKKELAIPYNVQGFLVSMTSWSFILTSPIIGYGMSFIDVKPIVIAGFVSYLCAYSSLLALRQLWCVFISLFVEGMGGVLLDVGINTLSTVIFTSHRGVMMNYLHFFYGLGSVLGPLYSSWFMGMMHFGYRGAFVGLLIFCVIGFVMAVFSRLSLKQNAVLDDSKDVEESLMVADGTKEESSVVIPAEKESLTVAEVPKEDPNAVLVPAKKESLTVWKSFITPMVWLLGLNMGAVCAIESITVNWAPLYLQYLYHIDPTSGGARFISLFYVFYTAARLVTGFVVDYFGDELSMILFNLLLIVWYGIAFALGRNGVWLLTFSGFFISPLYPTALSTAMHVFGSEAKNTVSTILCLSYVVSLVIQVIIGYVNEFIDPAWGYPILSVIASSVIILCMSVARLWLKRHSK